MEWTVTIVGYDAKGKPIAKVVGYPVGPRWMKDKAWDIARVRDVVRVKIDIQLPRND